MRSSSPIVPNSWAVILPRALACAGRSSAARTRSRARAGCLRARRRSMRSPTWRASASGTRRLIEGDHVRTGVTVIVPHAGNVFQDKVPGAVFVGNAFGKLAGSTQVDELGTIETPIALTNTLSVGAAVEGLVRVDDRSGRQRERAIGQRAGRRDQRRRPQRHSRPACASRARARGDQGGDRRTGSRGQRRRRHRNTGVRLEGRHRHRVAQARRALRRLHRRRAGAVELRRRADHGRRAGREGAWTLLVSAQARRPGPRRIATITATGRA